MDLIMLGLIAGAAWYYEQFQKLKQYQIKLKQIKVDFNKSLQYLFRNIYCTVTLQINNPSQLVATLSKLRLTAWYDGKIIGTLIKNEPITLQAGNMNYTFEIALSTLNLFGSINNAVAAIKSGQSVSIQIKGFGEVGKATLTINETVKLI